MGIENVTLDRVVRLKLGPEGSTATGIEVRTLTFILTKYIKSLQIRQLECQQLSREVLVTSD